MKMEILAQVLADADCGVLGQSIFAHKMDDRCEEGVLLRMPLDGVDRDPSMPDYYKTDSFQAIVRSTSQAAGDALAKKVAAALTIKSRQFSIGDGLVMEIKQMYPRNLPIVYPRSSGDGLEFSINFFVAYVLPGM